VRENPKADQSSGQTQSNSGTDKIHVQLWVNYKRTDLKNSGHSYTEAPAITRKCFKSFARFTRLLLRFSIANTWCEPLLQK